MFFVITPFAATTAQPQAVPPAGSSCADLVNVLPPQWQMTLNLTAPANATANPYWCCNSNNICCGEPSGCYNIGKVYGIFFQGMQLNGSTPDGLGSLTSLQKLHLFKNSLTGTIPESLGNLVNLTEL
ncbi:hypothetical protein BDK51DRAFT_31875, partial [Blyttiomyces helicus]